MANKKESVALSSVLASAGMTIMKLIVGIMTGSMGIVSEAAHSALDLGAAGLTLFAVKVSSKPADDDHPYGHGKMESVSALIETGLLFLTSAWIIYEAIHRIITKDFHVEATWYAFAVIIVSILIDISRSRALLKVAKETNSQALEADALHFSSDIWSSCVVLVGLVLVYFGVNGADTFAAIGVSIFVLVAGYRLGKRTIDVLMDAAPLGVADVVKEVVENVEGVIATDKIRVRPLGPSMFIELEIGISRSFSIIKVSDIVNKSKEAIQEKIKEADVLIHTKPIQLKDETILDIIRTIAFKHGLSVHSIVVDKLDGKKFISYDLELPGTLSVGEAHEKASHLEKEISGEIGTEVELYTHIDSCSLEEKESLKLEKDEIEKVEKIIKMAFKNVTTIKNPHNIIVREIGTELFVTLHCDADKSETLDKTHSEASKLKSLIKEKIPDVGNVVVHVEPEM